MSERQAHSTTGGYSAQLIGILYDYAKLGKVPGVEKVKKLNGYADLVTAATELDRGRVISYLASVAPDLAEAVKNHVPGKEPLELLSADDILTTDWPEPVWAVPDYLPVGLTILAGAPKLGKSWLALQIAQAVAAGGMALNKRVVGGPVLYLALEDTSRRLKDRMEKQGWPIGLPCQFLTMGKFVDQIGDLRGEGGERLAHQIETEGYRLVVIDTLSRSTTGDQNDVVAMTAALDPIQQMAHAQNCAILMIDHHRKGVKFDADAIGDILGSTGKGAMADTAWGLYRDRGKAGAKLSITGRDVNEVNLSLFMDWQTGCWQVEGDADSIALTDRRQEILDVLDQLGKSTCGAIAKAVEQDRGNTYRRLQDMVNANIILREDDGKSVLYAIGGLSF